MSKISFMIGRALTLLAQRRSLALHIRFKLCEPLDAEPPHAFDNECEVSLPAPLHADDPGRHTIRKQAFLIHIVGSFGQVLRCLAHAVIGIFDQLLALGTKEGGSEGDTADQLSLSFTGVYVSTV